MAMQDGKKSQRGDNECLVTVLIEVQHVCGRRGAGGYQREGSHFLLCCLLFIIPFVLIRL